MSEYILRDASGCDMSGYMDDGRTTVSEWYAKNNTDHYGTIHEEIVRCRDCDYYYEADNYHPSGNYTSRCCKYFDSYMNEVQPDGFCAWAVRAGA